ncbi:MAG: hypothetical protein KIT34_19050 [Cyanobacteria bacterium TGS_CYA1]|nr:hypothetical protein [Cyanobacteria bacterium TGS_CYA1]
MKIDLTQAFTIEDVAKLLASKDDSQLRQLRVTKNGSAYISDEVGSENIDALAFRFEIWGVGNSYCGLEASQDASWVRKVYNDLKENWPNPKSTFIDH